jgi:hypothetical protein
VVYEVHMAPRHGLKECSSMKKHHLGTLAGGGLDPLGKLNNIADDLNHASQGILRRRARVVYPVDLPPLSAK